MFINRLIALSILFIFFTIVSIFFVAYQRKEKAGFVPALSHSLIYSVKNSFL